MKRGYTPSYRPFGYTYTCPNEDCEADIDCTITPERPAPPCSNPSSPAYSDSGDPWEVECPDACPKCGERIDQESVYDEAIKNHGPSDDYDWDED